MKRLFILTSLLFVAAGLSAAQQGASATGRSSARKGATVSNAKPKRPSAAKKQKPYVPIDYAAEMRKLEEEDWQLFDEMKYTPGLVEEIRPEGTLKSLTEPLHLRAIVQHGESQFDQFAGLWYSPASSREKQLPLLVYVPGTGEIGSDLTRQFNQRGFFDKVLSAEFQEKHPCHVLAVSPPKCITSFFGSALWEPNSSQRRLVNFIDGARRLATGASVDTNRIYLAGFSYGGSAVAITAANHPGRYAAVVSIVGALPPEKWVHPKHPGNWWYFLNGSVPATAKQGQLNPLRAFQAAVNEAGGDFRLGAFPGEGHDAWNRTWQEEGMWDWLFSKSLVKVPSKPRIGGPQKRNGSQGRFVPVDGAACTASKPGIDSAHGPERVVDGLTDTFYRPLGGMNREGWWQADFLHEVKGRIEIYTGEKSGSQKLEGGVVETSRDGKSFARAGMISKKDGSCACELQRPIRYLRIRPNSSRVQEFVIRELRLLHRE